MSGELVVPAVPSMADDHAAMCAEVFATVGRAFTDEEHSQLWEAIRAQAEIAFAASSRSLLSITYEAAPSSAVSYLVRIVPSTMESTYTSWTTTREGPLFGTHPDARVLAVLAERERRTPLRILDIGAGTGRNALALARRGHFVDAIEPTPAFAAVIRETAAAEQLAVRVIERDAFAAADVLRYDHALIVASELVTDLRSADEVRALLQLAAERLLPGGNLVLNAFVAKPGYVPTEAVRELGQQLYTSVFTREELDPTTYGLPLDLVADDPALEYEQANLPAEAWPPTAWYVDWARGQDLFDLEAEDCPIELRWFVYERSESAGSST